MKFLLVEDHGVVREGVRRLLSVHFNAAVVEAADVETALALYDSEKPDLVLLDLNLEGTGGLEMLRRLCAASQEAKVIVFTMHSEPSYALRALRAGAR